MLNEVEELINRIDPSKQICECCTEWKDKKDFVRPTLFLNSSCRWHHFCMYCVVKIDYIKENEQYIPKEIEHLNKQFHHFAYFNKEGIDLSILYHRKLISCYYSCKRYIEHRKEINNLELQRTLYSTPKSWVMNEFC